MSKVIDMFAWQKEEKMSKPSIQDDIKEDSLIETMEKNFKNKQRIEAERKRANKAVVRSHALKKT